MLNCKIKDLFKSKIKNSYFSQIKISKKPLTLYTFKYYIILLVKFIA